jgi:hypothetical protein
MCAPQPRVDPVIVIERRDDDLGKRGIALGMARLAGEFNANLAKLRRERRVQDRFGMGALHIDQSMLRELAAEVVAAVIFALARPISQVLRRPPASSGF